MQMTYLAAADLARPASTWIQYSGLPSLAPEFCASFGRARGSPQRRLRVARAWRGG